MILMRVSTVSLLSVIREKPPHPQSSFFQTNESINDDIFALFCLLSICSTCLCFTFDDLKPFRNLVESVPWLNRSHTFVGRHENLQILRVLGILIQSLPHVPFFRPSLE